MPSDKPTTSELIDELRSISDYLSEDSPNIDDIPLLTDIATEANGDECETAETTETESSEKAVADHRENAEASFVESDDIEPAIVEHRCEPGHESTGQFDVTDAAQPDAEQAENAALEASENIEKDPPQNTSKLDEIEKVSDQLTKVAQPSLFDKPLENKGSPDQNADTESETKKVKKRPELKAKGENPFLPPHIRKQLGKHKKASTSDTPLWPPQDAIAQTASAAIANKKPEVQGDLLTGFSKSEADTVDNKSFASDEKAIASAVDELVNELLPEIEARLREKLKTKIAAWKESK